MTSSGTLGVLRETDQPENTPPREKLGPDMRTLTKKSITLKAVLGVALLVALTGCSAASEPEPKAAAKVETPAAPATPPAKECSGLTGVEALEKWANEVETTRAWDLAGEYSDVSGYDECAELSYIVLRPAECCTVFEITPVMFFNRGEFIPAATVADRAQARSSDAPAERIDDSTIAITFATPGGANMPPVLSTTTYSWDEATETVVAEEPDPSAGQPEGGNANGHWCPTPESGSQTGCVTIALPTATYDSGLTDELIDQGDTNGDGGTSYITPGAPFGTFYPAGTPIQLPDYYAGTDLPDQDRIWNGQTAVMLVRQ